MYNIAAALFWTSGAAILFIGLFITIFAVLKNDSGFIKKASYFTLCGGIFLSFSAMSRFFGGFSIPIGVPVILYIGWRMYRDNRVEYKYEEEPGDDEKSAPE
jgi:4-amino-4-deoxy-L-arabinose transferase-like glycosyltransferase